MPATIQARYGMRVHEVVDAGHLNRILPKRDAMCGGTETWSACGLQVSPLMSRTPMRSLGRSQLSALALRGRDTGMRLEINRGRGSD